MIPPLDPVSSLSVIVTILGCVIALFIGQYCDWPLFNDILSRERSPEACKKLGLGGKSNLADEHSPIHSGSQPDRTLWRVKSLWIYPVKSCKGVELETAVNFGTGLEYDRQFAFARWTKVSKSGELLKMGWKFLTQRDAPLLATIQPEVWVPDRCSMKYTESHPNVRSKGVIVIRYRLTEGSKMKAFEFPYAPTADQMKFLGFRIKTMTIWKDCPDCVLLASTENRDQWIEDVRRYIGVKTPLALFRVKSMQSRELFRNAPRIDEIGFQPTVGFQDAYPLHIMNIASVQDIASKFKDGSKTLSARNFRPNIIVTGGDAYAEDEWKRVKIGGNLFFTSCRTVRCLLPNVDQDTGKRHESEPNKTLKSYRKIDAGDPNNACLGMQMVPAIAEAVPIQVGDEVIVRETGNHVYVKQ